jgi:hypothetical protein
MRVVPSVRTAAPALAGLALLAGGLVQQVPPAGAFAEWCFDDPVVSINGQQVHINNGVMDSSTSVSKDVQGASVTVSVPKGASAKIVSPTGQLFIETVVIKTTSSTWSAGPVPVQVSTSFITKQNLQAAVQLSYSSTASGAVTTTAYGTTTSPIRASISVQ